MTPRHQRKREGSREVREWAARLAELREFFARHGHTRVPARGSANPVLAKWCDRQHADLWKLPPERVRELLAAGFHLPVKTSGWLAHYFDLVDYQTTHGHCNVPKDWPANPVLGRWVCKQRQAGRCVAERRRWLDRLGFVWNTKRANRLAHFEARYRDLLAFHAAHGHCNASHWNQPNVQLATWVGNLRARQDRLTREQKRRLNRLGFAWNPLESHWQDNLRRLREFHRQHGHCRVSLAHPDRRLGRWVVTLRWIKARQDRRHAPGGRTPGAKDHLTPERLRALAALGFDWKPLESRWETRFAELCDFKRRHGHCEVPRNYTGNRKLMNWVFELRAHPGRQSAEHRRRLEELGFHWQPDRSFWNRRIRELEVFHAAHGHSRVPARWQTSPHLAAWIAAQRRNHSKLTVAQFHQLDRLGVFRPRDHLSARLLAAREHAAHG